jgi:dynein heavy chain
VDTNTLSTRQLHVTANLAALKDTNLDGITVLYFLRQNLDSAVDINHMERDIFCGELKGNTITNLNALLSDIYVPLVKAQKNWGNTTIDTQNVLMTNMDKIMGNLNESASSLHSSKHVVSAQSSVNSLIG